MLTAELATIDPSCKRISEEKERRRGFVEVKFGNARTAGAGETVVTEWLRASSDLPPRYRGMPSNYELFMTDAHTIHDQRQ